MGLFTESQSGRLPAGAEPISRRRTAADIAVRRRRRRTRRPPPAPPLAMPPRRHGRRRRLPSERADLPAADEGAHSPAAGRAAGRAEPRDAAARHRPQEVRVLIRELCQSEKGCSTAAEQERLMDDVMDETFGLGPLETLLKDPTITDILVNRFDRIYCRAQGPAGAGRTCASATTRTCGRSSTASSAQVGRRIDEISPMVDARLPDGSRVNAIIPPLALDGPAMSHSPLRRQAAAARRPDPPRRVPAGGDGLPRRRRAGAVQHADHRRHRLGQDDAAQLPVALHPGRRARHHDRRRRRTAAPAAARRAPGNAPAEHRRQGRSHAARPGEELPAYAARSHHHRRSAASAKRWTCSRR